MQLDRRNFLAGAAAMTLAPSPTHAAPAADRQFWDSPFGKIAYVDRGHGKAALFLHGFPLNSHQWRDVIAPLSAHRRCIAPDYLSLGRTEALDGQDLSVGGQTMMVAALLDRLKIDKVDILANDSGGAVAQLFAVNHPGRVRSLLLTNCDTEPDSPPPAAEPLVKAGRAKIFADKIVLSWLQNKAAARSPQGLGGFFTFPDRLSDETLEIYLAPLVSSDRRKAQVNGYAAALDPNPLVGVGDKLRGLHAPVRIVWGMADSVFSAKSPDYLNSVLPNVRGVRLLPAAKLFFPEEYPELIAEEASHLWATTAA